MSDLQGVAIPKEVEQVGAPAAIERGVDPFTLVEGRYKIQTIDGRVLGIKGSSENRTPVTTTTTLLDPSDDVLWIVKKDDRNPEVEAFTLQNVGRKLYLVIPDAAGSGVIGSTRAQVLVQTRIESHPVAVRISLGRLVLQAAEQGNDNQRVTAQVENSASVGQYFVFRATDDAPGGRAV